MNVEWKRGLAAMALVSGAVVAAPVFADLKDLLEMSERLDKIEKQDFGEAIDKANACTRARDFSCTTSWLQKAGKLAGGARDKQMLAAAEQNMTNEKARIAEEERQRAEEQRRIAQAEERLRVAEAEAARRAQSSGPSTTMQLLQLGTAVMGSVANERARMAASAASRPSSSRGLPLADLSAERQAIEKARADAAAAQRAREQAAATRSAPAPATASRSAPTAPTVVAAAPPTTYYSATSTSCPPGMTSVPAASGTACVASGPSNRASAPSQSPAAPEPAAASAQNSQNTPTRVATTGAATANGGYPNLDRPPSAPQPKKLYPLVRHYTFDTYAFSEQQGCAEANKKVDAQYARHDDRVTMLTRANCSCTKEKDVYGSIFLCKVPVTDQLMVDYDPNVPSSNSSR